MTSLQEKKHKSDSVEVTVTTKPNCVVELLVKASPTLVQSSYRKAIKSIAKEVSIPGFRKGKAPDNLIEKKYSKHLEDRWKQEIADTSFKEAQQLAKVPLLNGNARISFDMQKHSKEDGAEMTFAFETEPVIPELEPSSLDVIDVQPEVIDDAKVSETIDHIRSFFGTWEPVKDRAVKEDDYVTLDIFNIESDPEEKALANTRFKVNRENMAKWMYDLVLGMKIGDKKEGVSTPDEDAPEEFKNENPAKKVRVELVTIQALDLPPIDDELAKKVGATSIEEMTSRLQKLLEKRSEKEARDRQRDHVADALVEQCAFDLPESILQKEVQFRVKQLANDPNYQERLKSMNEEEKKESIESVRKHADNAVRLFYICRALCNKFKLDVTPDDLAPAKMDSPLDAMFVDRNEFYDYKTLSQEQQAIVLSRIMLHKAEDYIIEKGNKVPDTEAKKPAQKKAAKKAVKKAAKKASAKKGTKADESSDTKKRAAPKKKPKAD